MAKKIKHESFIYHFLLKATKENFVNKKAPSLKWLNFINLLEFTYESGFCLIKMKNNSTIEAKVKLNDFTHCLRGDNLNSETNKSYEFQYCKVDPVKKQNETFFKDIIYKIAKKNNFY